MMVRKVALFARAMTILIAVIAAVSVTASLAVAADAVDGNKSINESSYVPIGGIDQWIQIRGDDRNNPVLLWLNGGPGYSTIPVTLSYSSWEKPFTVVMWDQRGESLTFERSGRSVASTMTIEKMSDDGIEVAQYLRQHLHTNKIILLGHSWGSILGMHMIHKRPDLFAAYVGTGQVVTLEKDAESAYPLLLEQAKALGNSEAESQLKSVGPPPYGDNRRKWVWVSWANRLDTRPPNSRRLIRNLPGKAADYLEAGADFSQGLMWESMMRDDLPALGLEFKLPIFFIQGAEDRLTVTALAKDYFGRISAPSKAFVELPGVGHLAIFSDPDSFLKELVTRVRPAVVKAQ